MISKVLKTWLSVAVVVAAAACDNANPARPSVSVTASTAQTSTSAPKSAKSARMVEGKMSVTVPSPQLATPNDGQQFRYVDQPITLTIKNGVTSGTTPLTYAIQVASDTSFANIVYSKSNIAGGADGQTSVTIDKLPGSATYTWRAQAMLGSANGPFSNPRTFRVGPQVVLENPVPASPAPGGTVNGTLTLTVNNIQRSGPAGPIQYQFDVSDSPSFGNVLSTATVA